jgi:hypothetical protein
MISLRCVKGVALAQKLHHQVQSSRLPCAWLNRNRWDKDWDEKIWPCFLHIAFQKAHWSWIQGVLTLFQQKGQETIWGRSLSDPPESCVRHSNLVASPGWRLPLRTNPAGRISQLQQIMLVVNQCQSSVQTIPINAFQSIFPTSSSPDEEMKQCRFFDEQENEWTNAPAYAR